MKTPKIIGVGNELPGPPPARPRPEKGLPGQECIQECIDDPKPAARKAQSARRFQALNSFVDRAMATLTRAELAVWVILFRDERDGTARTGRADLAHRAGCDRSTVTRALAGLVGRGLVEVTRRGGIRRGPNCYRVHPLAHTAR